MLEESAPSFEPMNPLEPEILRALQAGEDATAIAKRLRCSAGLVNVVAGRYMAVSPGSDRAGNAKRRQDTKAYHVTSVLNAEESRRCMAPLPDTVSVRAGNGERLVLVVKPPAPDCA